uniref:Uncharacterized protein n=1 Tax=Anguilla anguilla TaxID=7936 RepID=A0A0E9VKM7_ANGAN
MHTKHFLEIREDMRRELQKCLQDQVPCPESSQ